MNGVVRNQEESKSSESKKSCPCPLRNVSWGENAAAGGVDEDTPKTPRTSTTPGRHRRNELVCV